MHIITPSPEQNLIFSIFLYCFRFIKPLKCSIVLLIESSRLFHRNPIQIHPIKHRIQSFYRSLEIRSKSSFYLNIFFFQKFCSFLSLGNPFFCQIYICSPCKPIFLVPSTLSMTNQHQFSHHYYQKKYKIWIFSLKALSHWSDFSVFIIQKTPSSRKQNSSTKAWHLYYFM